MKELNNLERKKIIEFINAPIPNWVKNFDNNKIDLMECYEIGFMFAYVLLRNNKIDPSVSPWGDGKSLIFEPDYSEFLQNILKDNLSEEINNYCKIFLDTLEIFRNHFI